MDEEDAMECQRSAPTHSTLLNSIRLWGSAGPLNCCDVQTSESRTL